jgi:hypothetical protein
VGWIGDPLRYRVGGSDYRIPNFFGMPFWNRMEDKVTGVNGIGSNFFFGSLSGIGWKIKLPGRVIIGSQIFFGLLAGRRWKIGSACL